MTTSQSSTSAHSKCTGSFVTGTIGLLLSAAYLLLALVGCIGYILDKLGFRLAPMVIGLVLGPLVEKHLREELILSGGEISTLWGSPVAVVTWIIVIVVLVLGFLPRPREVAAKD